MRDIASTRRSSLAALAAALTLAICPAAYADGDPASDVLPSQDAYYPYQPPVSRENVTALDNLLKQVRKGGYPMKVAMIQTAGDLGSLAALMNDAQRYTNVLASELPSNPHGQVKDELHLLVVMPSGFGGQNLGDKVDEALAPIKIDTEAQSDGLSRAAMEAVARIATANGVKTEVPKEASGSSDDDGGGVSPVIWAILGVVIVGLIVGLVVVRRRAPAELPPEDGTELPEEDETERPEEDETERPEEAPETQETP